MVSNKLEFFEKGVNEQKTPSIIFSIKRIDSKKCNKWTKEQKKDAKRFLKDCKVALKRFDTYIFINS